MVYALDFSKFARLPLTDAGGRLTQEGISAMLELQRRTGTILGVFAASSVSFTPSGGLASTNVQGALTELDTEKGTVSSVAVVSANGFGGSVATASTTPAITLTTDLTGLLKGDGTAMSSAVAGTDYVAPGGALGTPSSGTLTNCTGLPVAGVTGLGTIATQAANNVAITGGAIDGTTVGATTQSTGRFTTVRTNATVVASLPAAATAGAGARSFVTDANATTFLSVVAGGGTNKVPVVSDGAQWLIG